MDEKQEPLLLSSRFTESVEYARQLHTEFRKGTEIPYMAHLLGVAALVMAEAGREVPVTEEMVMAAVLHDTVEDHGGEPRLRDVEKRFGADVARMVEGLSDTLAEDHNQKEGWEQRKRAYLERLRKESADVLLISAADKLYNAQSVLDDYREIGPRVWERFKRGAKEQLWYFGELRTIFLARASSSRSVQSFDRVLASLKTAVAEREQL
ncbi:MAG: HD domain-containing protein [Terracidiphilus sp.]|nr:HD domain-containing protein [Terracidiphilus sp.]